MEFGPIFRALMYHKSRFWLITVEVALTLAIVANCVNMMLNQRWLLLRPSGLDEAHLVSVSTEPFSEAFQEETFRDVQRELDLSQLRALPGVRAATAIDFFPLSNSGSARGRRALGSEIETISAPFYEVGTQALETLGVDLVAGRDFRAGDWPTDLEGQENWVPNVIITQDLADRLFPDGPVIGRQMENSRGELTETIVGVVRQMHNSWPRSYLAERVMLYPGRPGWDREMSYIVRAEPDATEAVFQQLEPLLRELNSERILTVRTLQEIKADTYNDSIVLINILSALIVVLVAVTSLGIVGLTSFSVTQRTRQIGTRRALGATRADILRYFLLENWIVTGIGLLFGSLLTVGLNMGLAHLADAPKMEWQLLAGGVILLWFAGLAAAAVPAFRATMVPPELATRTV